MITVHNGMKPVGLKEAVFFPFDEFSIPLRDGAFHRLLCGKGRGWRDTVVLRNGPQGAHDELVMYYGSVIQIGDTIHMWYIGRKSDPLSPYYERRWPRPEQTGRAAVVRPGDPPAQDMGISDKPGRVCYAVSKDGIHWEKPELGLVECNGNRRNNLVDFHQDADIHALAILHEPEDPDPARRFKMVYEAWRYGQRLAVAYSADGLRWTDSPNNPVGVKLELSGVTRMGGLYLVTGQTDGPYCSDEPGRLFTTLVSYDFEDWRHGGVYSLRRTPIPNTPFVREETHLGAGLHNRGNVILGIYGMWHHPVSDDRRHVQIDLGLAVSTDGMHYREPVANFKFLAGAEERESMGPALSQGQGMATLNGRTYYWYSLWPCAGGGGHVRIASWAQDRFGCFETKAGKPGRAVTCPFTVSAPGARVHLNLGGVGPHSEIRLALLDEKFHPIPGFTADDMTPLTAESFRAPVAWRGGAVIPADASPYRMQFSWHGLRAEDARVYAMYVEEATA